MTADFSSETTEAKKEVTQHFSSVKNKELSTVNSVVGDTILQKSRENKSILR